MYKAYFYNSDAICTGKNSERIEELELVQGCAYFTRLSMYFMQSFVSTKSLKSMNCKNSLSRRDISSFVIPPMRAYYSFLYYSSSKNLAATMMLVISSLFKNMSQLKSILVFISNIAMVLILYQNFAFKLIICIPVHAQGVQREVLECFLYAVNLNQSKHLACLRAFSVLCNPFHLISHTYRGLFGCVKRRLEFAFQLICICEHLLQNATDAVHQLLLAYMNDFITVRATL